MIVIEGPNNVGKTLIVNELKEILASAHFPELKFYASADMQEYFRDHITVAQNNHPEFITVWDRSWVSNYIYNRLLPDRGEKNPITDAFIGELEYGTTMQALGQGYIILRAENFGPDDTYPELDYQKELLAYSQYAKRFPHWKVLRVDGYTKADMARLAKQIAADYMKEASELRILRQLAAYCKPPDFLGNPYSKVLLVAPHARGNNPPFMYKSGLELLSRIGDSAVKCCMVSVGAVNPAYLRDFDIAFAFGTKASTWARYYARITEVVAMPQVHSVTDPEIAFISKSINSIIGE